MSKSDPPRIAKRLAKQPDAHDPYYLELFRKIAEGKESPNFESAFKEVFENLGGQVMSICIACLSNKEDAEDAFQATFLVLSEKAWQVREYPRTWLFMVARNAALHLCLQRKRERQARERLAASAVEQAEAPAADAATPNPELRKVIDAALEDLPEYDRAVLILRHCKGYSWLEVGKMLGTAEDTVRMRGTRALERLRSVPALKAYGASAVLAALAAAPRQAKALPKLDMSAVSDTAKQLAAEVTAGMKSGVLIKAACAVAVCLVAIGGVGAVMFATIPPPPNSEPPPAGRFVAAPVPRAGRFRQRTDGEARAVRNSLEVIRARQVKEGPHKGAVVVHLDEQPPQNPRDAGTDNDKRHWLQPGIAFECGIALCWNLKYEREHNPKYELATEDAERVRGVLEWAARVQKKDGSISDYKGTRVGDSVQYRSINRDFSWPSTAGRFLVAIETYRSLGYQLSPEVQQAAKKAMNAIKAATTSKDGLACTRPPGAPRDRYPLFFLTENQHLLAGLTAGEVLFEAMNEPELVKAAAGQAEQLRTALPNFWRADSGRFAYYRGETGQYVTHSSDDRPVVVANVSGLTWLSSKEFAPWNDMLAKRPPDDGIDPAAGAELYAVAAARLGPKEGEKWRAKVVAESEKFDPKRVYVHRAARTILALTCGGDWAAGLVQPKR